MAAASLRISSPVKSHSIAGRNSPLAALFNCIGRAGSWQLGVKSGASTAQLTVGWLRSCPTDSGLRTPDYRLATRSCSQLSCRQLSPIEWQVLPPSSRGGCVFHATFFFVFLLHPLPFFKRPPGSVNSSCAGGLGAATLHVFQPIFQPYPTS